MRLQDVREGGSGILADVACDGRLTSKIVLCTSFACRHTEFSLVGRVITHLPNQTITRGGPTYRTTSGATGSDAGLAMECGRF